MIPRRGVQTVGTPRPRGTRRAGIGGRGPLDRIPAGVGISPKTATAGESPFTR